MIRESQRRGWECGVEYRMDPLGYHCVLFRPSTAGVEYYNWATGKTVQLSADIYPDRECILRLPDAGMVLAMAEAFSGHVSFGSADVIAELRKQLQHEQDRVDEFLDRLLP